MHINKKLILIAYYLKLSRNIPIYSFIFPLSQFLSYSVSPLPLPLSRARFHFLSYSFKHDRRNTLYSVTERNLTKSIFYSCNITQFFILQSFEIIIVL